MSHYVDIKMLEENIKKAIEYTPCVDVVDRYKYDEVINFCEWVASEVMKEELWEVNSDSFAEIACRKLYKLGIVDKQGDSWVYKEK